MLKIHNKLMSEEKILKHLYPNLDKFDSQFIGIVYKIKFIFLVQIDNY
jgi:hypothetical protein